MNPKVTKINILITGADGQLGNCLNDISPNFADKYSFFFTDIEDLDITNRSNIEDFVKDNKIAIIINAAAYTAVDKAEDEPEKAYLVNCDAVENLAIVSKKYECLLVHISTDYVFDGNLPIPHNEDDIPNPKSVYGKSKLAGEKAIETSGCSAIIIRTSWLYSEYGNNFVKTMLRLGREKDNINVIFDQTGSPTYAGDLASIIFGLLDKRRNSEKVDYFHFSNEGVCSWFDFATTIMKFANRDCKITPILTSEYSTKAERPSYSVFNLSKIRNLQIAGIPYWSDSLRLVINKLEEK